MRSLVLHGLALLIAAGCDRPAAPAVPVRVIVHDEYGDPVSRALVLVDSVHQCETSAAGEGNVELPPLAQGTGGSVELQVKCPDGHLHPPARRLRVAHSGLRTLEFLCVRKIHRALIAMRVPGGEGLGIRVDGEPVGTVGADGTAHLDVIRAPGSELRVSIETSSKPRLRPQSPVRSFTTGDRDALFLFDQPLSVVTPSRRRRPTKRQTRTARPRRLRTL
jgi:hypothetical protein